MTTTRGRWPTAEVQRNDNYGGDENHENRDAVGSRMWSGVSREIDETYGGGDDSYAKVVEMDAEGRGRNRQK